jgi:hypothetical protein
MGQLLSQPLILAAKLLAQHGPDMCLRMCVACPQTTVFTFWKRLRAFFENMNVLCWVLSRKVPPDEEFSLAHCWTALHGTVNALTVQREVHCVKTGFLMEPSWKLVEGCVRRLTMLPKQMVRQCPLSEGLITNWVCLIMKE